MGEMLLHHEIEQRFGVLPNFFRLTSDTPEVTTNFWGFAKFAYLDSPLPSLFKERLFVYLSCFCEVRYCIARHIGFLVGLGYRAGDRDCLPQTVEQALPLLQRPLPRGEALESAISCCTVSDSARFEFPTADTPEEGAIFACAAHVFLQTPDAPRAIAALRQGLGPARLELLNVFLAFVRMAHYWTQIHLELRFEDDINHLLATHETLAKYILNDPEIEDHTLSQQVLASAEPRQLKEEHESLQQAYEVVSREKEQLPIERQERQRVEENLRDSEARFSGVFSNNMVAMGIWTDTGGITDANDALLNLIGYTRQELEAGSLDWGALTPPEYRDRDAQAIAEVRADGACTSYEKEFIHKDGHRIPILIGGGHFDDQNGAGVFFALDLTERKRAEIALRESEEQLRLFVAASSDIVYKMGADWRELRQLEGKEFLTSTENPSCTWLEQYVPLEDQPQVMAVIQAAIRTKSPFELEHRVIQRDGTIGWIYSRAIPLLNDQHEIVEWIGAASDISDRVRVEAERNRREANLAFLAEIQDDCARLTTADAMMQTIGAKIGAYLNLSVCAFVDVDETQDQAIVPYAWHRADVRNLVGTYRISEFVSEEFRIAARAGTVVVVNNTNTDTRTDAESCAAIDVQAFIHVPFLYDGQWKFLLNGYDACPRDWREHEIELFCDLANRIFPRLERARAEAALRASEEKYRTLFDSLDEGVGTIELIFDENERVVDYCYLEQNSSFTRLTGLPSDVTGKRISEIVPNLEAFWFETFERVAKTGEPQRFEHAVAALDRWFEVYVSRVGGVGSRKVVYVYNNITERKRAEDERKQAEATIATDLENTRLLRDLSARLINEDEIKCFMTKLWRLRSR